VFGWPAVELRRLRLVLSAAAGCPASGGVPGPGGYLAGQSGVGSSVLMSPFLMCVLLVTPFRINESRWSKWAPFIPVTCCPVCSAIGWLVELVGMARWM